MISMYILIPSCILLFIAMIGIRIVRPTHNLVVETLGKFTELAESGFTWIFPVIQSSTYVNITEQMVDVEPQMVITKDKLNAEVDAVVYYKVNDVKKSLYNVNNHRRQLTSLTRTTLRSVIGKMSLIDANEKRDEVNRNVEKVLTEETATYGVGILRVEIQRIEPPTDVQNAMNEVVKAEQKKIAAKDTVAALETEADGYKRASIKKAEGGKQAAILEAEGKAKAFDMIKKSFTGNAQILKKLEVTENSLKSNAKIVITEKGISPQLIIGNLPIK